MTNIPFSLKIAAKPLLILALLVSLSLIGLSRAFYEVGSLKEEQTQASKNENILKSKLDILSTNEANVETNTNFAVSFLPGENSALSVLYQLRGNAVTNGLLLSNLNVGSEVKDENGFMTVSFSFDLQGSLQQILDFVNLIKNIAPNIWIEKTELNFAGDRLQASINTKSYWSPFPTKIPALTEPIISLNSAEKEILTKVSSFNQPSFVILIPTAPRENTNPFGE